MEEVFQFYRGSDGLPGITCSKLVMFFLSRFNVRFLLRSEDPKERAVAFVI